MPTPARHTLAIVGAGPIGLEAAAAALDAGLDVHVFERGEIGAHPIAWGHMTMFTPWRMNLGPSATARLERSGWTRPDLDVCPTGAELAERYLAPLARLPELRERIHSHAQVVFAGRSGELKGDDAGTPDRRRAHPFRLLVRDAGGRENFLAAYHVIDASGVYGQPNWAGDGGIPARSELYLAPQLSYHADDVLGLRRERYAGVRTLVIGAGSTAATLVADLAKLADEVPGTTVAWATRKPATALFPLADDPLPVRRALHERARALALGAHPAVTHVGGVRVEGFEFNSATHRYRATLPIGDRAHVEEVSQILVATGFGPDNSIYRELQVHECWASRGPMKLSTALLAWTRPIASRRRRSARISLRTRSRTSGSSATSPYGRSPNFLLETGYHQVAEVIAQIAERIGQAAKA